MASSARRIAIPHPDLSKVPRTNIGSDYTAASTTLTVVNNDGFAANSIAVVGQPGEEESESKPIASITGVTTITTTAGGLTFGHNKDTVVYRSEYDQVELSYYTAGAWTVLDTIPIQWNHKNTIYVHQGGLDSYLYRFRLKNSVTSDTSEYSGSVAGSGYSKLQVGSLIENVRRIVGDPEKKIVSDFEILRLFTTAKDVIRGKRADWWFWRRESEGAITTTVNTRKYDLDTISERIDYIKDVRFNYNDGSVNEIYPIKHKTDLEFDQLVKDNNETTDDRVRFYNLMPPDSNSTSGYIRVDPKPKTTGYGSFYVRYYINEPDFTSPSDTTSIPLPQLLENYAISVIEGYKGNDVKSKAFRILFYGPADRDKDSSQLVGIPLLEQMHRNKLRPLGQPRQLKRFNGRRAIESYYQASAVSEDSRRENYW